jgi:hypothetical protein
MWATPRIWIDGKVITTVMLNAHIRDQMLSQLVGRDAELRASPAQIHVTAPGVEAGVELGPSLQASRGRGVRPSEIGSNHPRRAISSWIGRRGSLPNSCAARTLLDYQPTRVMLWSGLCEKPLSPSPSTNGKPSFVTETSARFGATGAPVGGASCIASTCRLSG